MQYNKIALLFLFVSLSLAHLTLDPEQQGNTRVRNPNVNYNTLHQRGCTGENSHERACESACSCSTVFASTVYPSDILPQVRTAFEFSKCIWSCVLKDLPITRNEDLIRIHVNSFQSESLTLATGRGRFTEISGTQTSICAAESVRGSTQCNLKSEDIIININTDLSIYPNFYFGLDCNPASNQIDFVSVALHELGHGLGFSGMIANNMIGYKSFASVAVIDTYYTVGINGTKPWAVAPPSSIDAAVAALVSDNLFFDGVLFDNGKLFAPATFEDGTSIYHWDENTYPAGDVNSLMTPVIGFGEAIHAIGPLTCDYLTRWGYPISNITALCGREVLATPPSSPSRAPAPTSGASRSRTPAASQTGTPTKVASLPVLTRSVSLTASSTKALNSQASTRSASQAVSPTSVAPSQSRFTVSLSATRTRPATSPISSHVPSRSVPNGSDIDPTVSRQAVNSSEGLSSSSSLLTASVIVLALFVSFSIL